MPKGNQLTRDVAIVGDIQTITPGQVQKVLTNTVARTDTAAKTLGVLPAGAVIIGITVYGTAVSNAATTATLSLGKSGGTGTEFLNALDVKGATGAGQQTPTGGVLGSVGTSAVTVTGTYAETGTASTSGGPWRIVIEYVTV